MKGRCWSQLSQKKYCRMSQHSDFLVSQWIPQYLKESKVDLFFSVCKLENPLRFSWDIQKKTFGKKIRSQKHVSTPNFFLFEMFFGAWTPNSPNKGIVNGDATAWALTGRLNGRPEPIVVNGVGFTPVYRGHKSIYNWVWAHLVWLSLIYKWYIMPGGWLQTIYHTCTTTNQYIYI